MRSWLLLILASAVVAGVEAEENVEGASPRPSSSSLTVSVRPSFTAAGTVEYEGQSSDESAARGVVVAVDRRFPFGKAVAGSLGVEYSSIGMDDVAGIPVPSRIGTVDAGIGLTYMASVQWIITTRLAGTLYRLDDVDQNAVGFGGSALAIWNRSRDLQFAFGLVVEKDSDYPVLPVAGLNWNINDQWALDLMFPRPRLVYHVDPQWNMFGGLEMAGATFMGENDFGNEVGDARFDDALGTYRDIRLGAGLEFAGKGPLRFLVSAGYSIHRQIEYTDLDETVDFDSSPYMGAQLDIGF